MARLVFENVTVAYPIYNARSMSVRNHLVRIGTGGRIGAESGQVVTVTAVDDVSFSLSDGDSVALVGHNGAGKSTLLRTMAGIYQPIAGNVFREGSVTTVFELGAGMDLELSGYDNIIRVMMLLGKSRDQAERQVPEIEDFTELGEYLRLPVRTYSTGMTTRLMFAVATLADPSILLVDEIFGTGDGSFQEKARRRMHEVVYGSKIFVFASHDKALVKHLCNRVFRLDSGKIIEQSIDEL